MGPLPHPPNPPTHPPTPHLPSSPHRTLNRTKELHLKKFWFGTAARKQYDGDPFIPARPQGSVPQRPPSTEQGRGETNPGEEKVVTSSRACTPQRADRRADGLRGKGDRKKSERALGADGKARQERPELPGEGMPLKTYLQKEENLGENRLPEKAAQVFSPADEVGCAIGHVSASLIFPVLVWGGFVFLPFDAPLLDSAPLRLVYTLRCSVFAAAPIVLGWLVLGISRLKSASTPTLFDENLKEAECKEVAVHQRFITDSASLFLIYFLQMVVMAMYLTQEQLKLIPLLTIVFAFGRLVYWGAAAFGSSIRGFGFGLSFLPGVVMMAANFYFIFLVEADGSIFSAQVPPVEVLPPPSGKQRFWG
uniref:Transmembrane protein 79b n=1 Tax=Oryzias latipes TaxID=8090 RepID=A0A3B3H3X9_ORYLA